MPSHGNLYDAVDYGGFINPNSHPGQLAVMGYLHGLTPAPVATCRVLEIGCNEGRNLIPMAYAMPGATFVGFDLAHDPIARGRERISLLGLTNIRLLQADIMEVNRGSGPVIEDFDYIIGHGVYAWVPPPVRDRLLALCRDLLTPEGVAFISYNAFPGGHIRSLIRDVLSLHLPHTTDRLADVDASLDFLEFLATGRPEGDPIRGLLEKELKQLRKKGPNIIFHDELEEGFGPTSFADFIAHAGGNGLQYISEATIPPPTDPCFNPQAAAIVKALSKGDPVVEEQTFDFLRMRMYRETLLCRADRPAHRFVNLNLDLRYLDRLRLVALAEVAAADIPAQSDASTTYTLPGGIRVPLDQPALILLTDTLIDLWPHSLSMPEVEALLVENGFSLDANLLTNLFRVIVARLLQLRSWEPPLASTLSNRPLATATSREDAALRARAATLIHTVLDLGDPLVRQLLFLLDGTRDRAALLAALHTANPEVLSETIEQGIEPTLQVLYRACVLQA